MTPGSGRSLEVEMTTHSSMLAWKISWTEEPGKLQSIGSQKSQTQLSDRGHTSCLAKVETEISVLNLTIILKPHSSTLAWKIPWTEQPGGPQSMGSLRVGHD